MLQHEYESEKQLKERVDKDEIYSEVDSLYAMRILALRRQTDRMNQLVQQHSAVKHQRHKLLTLLGITDDKPKKDILKRG